MGMDVGVGVACAKIITGSQVVMFSCFDSQRHLDKFLSNISLVLDPPVCLQEHAIYELETSHKHTTRRFDKDHK